MQIKYENLDKTATDIMLAAERNCVQKFRYHTSWSLSLMKASKMVRYWNLRLSISNERTVVTSVLETARTDAGLRDFTATKEQILVKKNLAKKKLRETITTAEDLREKELRKRAEDAAQDGDEKSTVSYETLLEHEQSRAKWRKTKYYLNTGDTEPLTRLLITENGQQKILTDGAQGMKR